MSAETIAMSHALNGESAKLRELYRTWASGYDDDVLSEDYQGPQVVATLLDEWSDTTTEGAAVLDAGCGTGLVGIELARRGYRTIDGCDLSEEMAEVARGTGVYRDLHSGIDLNWDLGTVPCEYDLVACCGVFTLGHVQPSALNQLLKAVRPGGVVVVSTRDRYVRTTPFREHLDWLQRENKAVLCQEVHGAPYIADENGSYWVLRNRFTGA